MIGKYDIIDDGTVKADQQYTALTGTAISSSKGQLKDSLKNVQTCSVEVSMGL
jgi:hypothetical protein